MTERLFTIDADRATFHINEKTSMKKEYLQDVLRTIWYSRRPRSPYTLVSHDHIWFFLWNAWGTNTMQDGYQCLCRLMYCNTCTCCTSCLATKWWLIRSLFVPWNQQFMYTPPPHHSLPHTLSLSPSTPLPHPIPPHTLTPHTPSPPTHPPPHTTPFNTPLPPTVPSSHWQPQGPNPKIQDSGTPPETRQRHE